MFRPGGVVFRLRFDAGIICTRFEESGSASPGFEPGWFEFFIAIAPVEADHGNRAHVVVTEELTARNGYVLRKFGRKLGLRVNVSRNSADWLASKKGVSEHACKIAYTVNHLRRRGSDFRGSGSSTPEWVRRARGA